MEKRQAPTRAEGAFDLAVARALAPSGDYLAGRTLKLGGFRWSQHFTWFDAAGRLLRQDHGSQCTWADDAPARTVQAPQGAAFVEVAGCTSGNGYRSWHFVEKVGPARRRVQAPGHDWLADKSAGEVLKKARLRTGQAGA